MLTVQGTQFHHYTCKYSHGWYHRPYRMYYPNSFVRRNKRNKGYKPWGVLNNATTTIQEYYSGRTESTKKVCNNKNIMPVGGSKGNVTVVIRKKDYNINICTLLNPEHSKNLAWNVKRSYRIIVRTEEAMTAIAITNKYKNGNPIRHIVDNYGSLIYELANTLTKQAVCRITYKFREKFWTNKKIPTVAIISSFANVRQLPKL